jgi:YD repeat-containing protein
MAFAWRLMLGAALTLAFALPAAAATIQYVYDPVGRLTAVIDPDGDTTEYVYDDVGNILSVTRRSTVALAIVSFSPAAGPVGTIVTLAGTGFDPTPANNTVAFAGAPAVVSSATATQLVAAVPAGAITGPITVSNSRGNATSAVPFTVTVVGPPTISSFVPSIGTIGQPLVISGTNFSATPAGNQVKINQSTATVQSAAVDSITATIPTASGGKITVTTPTGSATGTNDFFIAPAPRVAGDIGATGRIAINGPALPVTLAATKHALALVDVAAADTGLRAVVRDATFSPGFIIGTYRPDGTVFATSPSIGSNGGGSLALPAPSAAGTYSVLVTPPRSGDAKISVVRDVFGTLPNETPLDFVVAQRGQEGHFTFQASAGDKPFLIFNGITTGTGGVYAIRRPDGGFFLQGQAYSEGTAPKLTALPATGTYTLDVTPDPSATTGKVTLKLRNIPEIDAGVLAPDTPKEINFTSDLQVARTTFSGTAGTVFGFRVSDVTFAGSGSVRITRSDGSIFLNSTTLNSAGVALLLPPLPVTGTYVVEVTSGSSGGNATITLRSNPIVDAGTLTIDQATPITFTSDFQTARATFAGTAGALLGVSVSNVTFSGSGALKVTRADGAIILNTTTVPGAGLGVRLAALPSTATYVVELTSGSSGGTATLAVWRDVAGGALTVDAPTPTAMSIPFPAQQGRFTFTTTTSAQLGMILSGVTLPAGGSLSFLNASGSGVFSQVFTTAGLPATRLPSLAAGTYTIVVTPNSNGTGSLSMQLWADINAGSIAVGETKTISVVNPAQQSRFNFTVATGDQMGFALSDVTMTSGGSLSFLNASGSGVFSQVFTTAGLPATRLPSLAAGTYTVVVTPNSNGTGSFKFKLWKDVSAIPVTVDSPTPVTMVITDAAQQGRFTFTTTTSAQLGMILSGVTLPAGGSLSFLNASGSGVFSQVFTTAGLPATRLPSLAAGTYTIVVTPNSNGTGSLSMQLWADINAGSIAVGETKTISVVNPAQQSRFNFTVATGDQMGFALSDVTMTSGGSLSFLNASGSGVFSQVFTTAGLPATRLPSLAAGTYTVVVTPNSNGTGSFKFKLWKDVSAIPVTVDSPTPVTMVITDAAQQGRFTFTTTTSAQLGMILSGVTLPAGGSLSFLNASGSGVFSQVFTTAGLPATRLPSLAAGTYTIVVTPNSNGTGSLSMQLWADINAGSIAVGETKTISVVNPAQQSRFNFTVATGDQMGFALSDVTMTSGGSLSFLNASGSGVFSQVFTTAGLPATRMPSLAAGTYTVVVTPNANGTGSFKFKLWKDVSAIPVTVDSPTPVTMVITDAAQQGRFTFTTTTSAQLGMILSGVTLPAGGSLSFLNASGSGVFSQVFTTAGLPATRLPSLAAGTYTIVVTPNSNGTGSLSMQLWADINAGSIAVGETKTISVVNPAQQSRFNFTVATGDQMGFALSDVTMTSGGSLSFLNASGSGVFSQVFTTAGLPATRLPSLAAGTYTVVVTPNSNGTGSFSFTLWKDATGTLALATPFSLAIAFPAQQARLTFAGTIGQNLALAFALPTFASGGTVQVLSPASSQIASTTFGTSAFTLNIPTLGADGNYTVVVTPSGNGTGTATVTLGTR